MTPPYFEVKGKFDFEWDSFDSYLKTVELWAAELSRILSESGSLFWWGNTKKIAYSQIILDKYLNLKNSMVWEKYDSQQLAKCSVELSRCFTTHTERLLFYSKKNEYQIPETGWEKIHREKIKPRHPFAKYMKSELERAVVSNKEISKLFPSKTGGLTGCVSNWTNGDNIPTKEQYIKIRDFLNGEYLRREYEDLRQEYEELRQEYEELRRPFNNVQKLTDVLKFSQESHITKLHRHPTQKTPSLCRSLVSTCGRVGGNAFIPFLGSGVEAVECFNFGMSVVGCELDPDYYTAAVERFKKETRQIDMLGYK